VIVLVAMPSWAPAASAQSEGGDASTVAGAALGLYSGAALGLVGSLEACNRTLVGPRCALVSAAFGGAVGVASGAIIGSKSSDEVLTRARGAVYGSLIGAFTGAVLEGAVRQYAWQDALLVAGLGAAVGAAPVGAVLGLGAGTVLGGLAWAVLPSGGPADVVLLALVGSATGALYDWVAHAAEPDKGGAPALVASFSVPIG